MVNIAHVSIYCASNFRVFPIHGHNYGGESPGKKPKIAEWQKIKLTSTPPPTRYRSAEFGVALDENHLIIDIDPRNGGDESFKKLCKDCGHDLEMLATVKVLSGREDGGMHLYFLKPVKNKIFKKIKDYPGIDFLSKGQYVVGTGSRHAATGKKYKFTIDSLSLNEITAAPHKLLEMLKKHDVFLPPGTGLTTYADTPQNIERAIEKLNKLPPAIQGQRGDEQTYIAAATCKDFGLSPLTTLNTLLDNYNDRCEPPWDVEDLQVKIKHAYAYGTSPKGSNTPEAHFKDVVTDVDLPKKELTPKEAEEQTDELTSWEDHIVVDKFGKPKINLFKNNCLYLTYLPALQNLVGYNMLEAALFMKYPAPWLYKQNNIDLKTFPSDGIMWRDVDYVNLRAFFNAIDYDANVGTIKESIDHIAQYNAYHPIQDYFNSLVWDKKLRLSNWLTKYMGVEQNKYTQAVARKTLLAAVTRTFNRGCKFDHILILEGDQRIGKSTAIATLAKQWYSDAYIDVQNKDSIAQLQGILLYELGEMACSTKTETEALKAFVSRSTDKARLAYRQNAEKFPRQCIFIGTSNKNDYLKDETGNSRFWPVKCNGSVKLEQLKADRDQLWAEAVHVFKTKPEPLYLENYDIQEMASIQQESRRAFDEWENIIIEWLDQHDHNRITGKEIWVGCFGKAMVNFDQGSQRRISSCMKALNWDRKAYRVGPYEIKKGYVRGMLG